MATKTPYEIKKGLSICIGGRSDKCPECPYYGDWICKWHVKYDAHAYIERLEEQIMLMKVQMHGDCGVCAHRDNAQVTKHGPDFSGPCAECITKETRPNWKYEGLPEVKSR